MDIIPIEIVQHITDYCDCRTTVQIISSCKTFRQDIYIKYMYNISWNTRRRLNDYILTQNMFRNLIQLDIRDNERIINVSYLTMLKKLDVRNSKLTQDSIKGLKLEEIDVSVMSTIRDVSSMSGTLKVLRCQNGFHICGITQECINKLHLTELHAAGNKNINNVTHMKESLKVLDCRWGCGIDQDSINELYLVKLIASNTRHITKISHMKYTLTELYVDHYCGIKQECINELMLTKLSVYDNSKITYVGHMSTLQSLNCGAIIPSNCGVKQDSIDRLSLIKLKFQGNPYISRISHMTNLESLACGSNITQDEIAGLRLRSLNITNNKNITCICHMRETIEKIGCATKSKVREKCVEMLKFEIDYTKYTYNEYFVPYVRRSKDI